MATATTAATDRIGDILIREGMISNEQLAAALADAKANNTRVGYSLIKLGHIAETDLTRTLARQYRVPAVDLEKVNIDPKIIKLVSADLAHKHLVLPLRRVGRTLTIAMANPIDVAAIAALRFSTSHDIEPVVVGEYTLRNHLHKYYPEQAVQAEADKQNLAQLLDQIETQDELEVIEER